MKYDVVRLWGPGGAAAFNLPAFSAERGRAIRKVKVISSAVTTSTPGNEWDITLENLTTGNTVAAHNTDTGGDLAADTVLELTLDRGEMQVSAGDVIQLQFDDTGTATDLSGEVVTVEVEWI